jgi:hypothetical protein
VRAIRFLPVVFLVGIDGFAMFAPYVVLLFVTGYVISRLRNDVPAGSAGSDESAELPLESVG